MLFLVYCLGVGLAFLITCPTLIEAMQAKGWLKTPESEEVFATVVICLLAGLALTPVILKLEWATV